LVSSNFNEFPDLPGPVSVSPLYAISRYLPQKDQILKVSSARHELLWLEIRHLRKQIIKASGRSLGASEISCLHRWKEKEGSRSAQKVKSYQIDH
jgi:hypothetical protein